MSSEDQALSTEIALKAFENRPHRAEPLYDLAKHFRERGMNEVSLIFSERGLRIPYPKQDLLFVEDGIYKWGLHEEFSICAFYSQEPQVRAYGAKICDALSLDRDVPMETRDLARRNLEFYLAPIAEVLPTWQARRLTFAPKPGYLPMCPSVTRLGNRIMAAQRLVNYKIDERGYVRIMDDKPLTAGAKIHTRTLLLEIDPETLAESVHGEIMLPVDLPPPQQDRITGFEDMRLFEWRGDLWSLSTVLDQNPDAFAEQWLARIGPDLRMCEACPIYPEGPRRPREKNWMPFVDGYTLRFIYQCDATRIIDVEGRTLKQWTSPIAADHFSGSSQAIPFDDGWLCVIHWRQWFDNWPKYRHRFVWFDRDLKLSAVSPGWVFPSSPELELLKGYQYVTGLCWHPDEHRLIMGYQLNERESWVGAFDSDDVRKILSKKEETTLQAPSMARSPITRPVLPTLEFNQALLYDGQVDNATQQLHDLGLPEHRDRTKNWDTLLAIWACKEHVAKNDRVLDAGASRGWSAFLPGLAKLGYKDLIGINLEGPAVVDGDIIYDIGDFTKTDYPDGAFAFVASLSVIEHGVSLPAFFDEMDRIIQPGGHLFVSFDYWEDPIDCGGQMAFGHPVKIFTRQDVDHMLGIAACYGFKPTSDVDLTCKDRVCEWIGLKFTFANLLLRHA